MNILYLVHDLNDAAVCKRISMLKQGGANVFVAGFYRSGAQHLNFDDPNVIPLCQTYDASFIDRTLKVIQQRFVIKCKLPKVKYDVVMARNLDLLPLASKLSNEFDIPIVYECLDIHRFLINDGVKGKVFRHIERLLCKNVKLLITSSPGFVKHYFTSMSLTQLPYVVVENKVYSPSPLPPTHVKKFDLNNITISWNGAIRCSKSLDILSRVTRALEGKVQVEIYGRPSYSEFNDFDTLVNNEPYIHFKGGYQYPSGLTDVYRNADFNWTLDFFEEGGNSEWLLPNRIYEGGYFGIPPIYRSSTVTGDILSDVNVGVGFKQDLEQSLITYFQNLTFADYQAIKQAAIDCPSSRWVFDQDQCQNLVKLLKGISQNTITSHQLETTNYGV